MTIELTAENQRLIERVIHSGAYGDPQDVISAALEALAEDVEDVVDRRIRPLKTGYGSWASFGQAPSAEEIDENRREMFQGFAQHS